MTTFTRHAAILLATLAGGTALAQGLPVPLPGSGTSTSPAPAATPAPAPAPPPPEALPDSEVPRAAIRAETRLRAIRSLAARTRETDAIVASERSVLDSVEALKEWRRSREPRQQTPRALRSLGQEWRVNLDLLGSWMGTTGRRLDALSSARSELRTLHEVWTLTAARLEADRARSEVVERARTVLAAIREAEDRVAAEIDRVLLLESRISAARLDAEEALEEIASALREERRSLVRIESPPIWALLRAGADRPTGLGELRAENWRALTQYADRDSQRLWLQAVLFLLLVVAFHRLRGASTSWPADSPGVAACARLVERPLSGAALVALLGGLLLHPRAPLAFYELTSILLVGPVIFLLRGIVRPGSRGLLRAIGAIFIVERLWEATWGGSLLERTVLLILTGLSGAVTAWTFRPGAPAPRLVSVRWWSAVTVTARVCLVALAVSLVSNLVGNVSLSRLLTSTVVRAAYGGVVLYAAALLLRGGTELLLRSPVTAGIRSLQRHRDLLLRRATFAVHAGMMFLFLAIVLSAAGVIPLAAEVANEVIFEPWGIGSFRFSPVSLLVFVAAVWASVVASRVIRAVLEEDVYSRVTLPRGVAGTVTMLARYGIFSLGFLLALSIAGIPLDRLAIVLGAFSVGIGFGLQTVVNNFVSGLILMFERPIQIGDTVEVGGLVGRVRRIGVRASTVETFDGAEVIVPNGTLVSSQLINWTLSSRSRRIEVQVGVAYGTDPERVLALLRESVKGHPSVLASPEPFAIFRGFGASSLDFSLLFWTADFEGWTLVRSDATVRVNRALAEAGITIPFPQQDVWIRQEAAEEPAAARPGARGAPV